MPGPKMEQGIQWDQNLQVLCNVTALCHQVSRFSVLEVPRLFQTQGTTNPLTQDHIPDDL